MTDLDRLLSRCIPEPNTGCWLWLGYVDKKGYGQASVDGRSRRAHRVSYQLHKGPIGEDLHVMHDCDNPSCVNPDHLSLGTSQENNRDRNLRNRQARGERNGQSKLTAEQVELIRSGQIGTKAAARKFGVSPRAITLIKSGKNWTSPLSATGGAK
jgi:hypothetical protein